MKTPNVKMSDSYNDKVKDGLLVHSRKDHISGCLGCPYDRLPKHQCFEILCQDALRRINRLESNECVYQRVAKAVCGHEGAPADEIIAEFHLLKKQAHNANEALIKASKMLENPMICGVPTQDLMAVFYALQANGIHASEIKDAAQLAKLIYQTTFDSLDLMFKNALEEGKAIRSVFDGEVKPDER